MSTVQTLLDRARILNNVDVYQYPDSIALQDINYVIHQIEDYITSAIGEGYFWDILSVTTTVVGQSEYTLPVISSGAFNGTPKIENISIKYESDYIKARPVNRQTLENDLSWYEVNQSYADPFYFIADNSFFIYPAPLTAVTDGIRLYGIKSLADITLSTTYEELFGGKIPSKYYYLIADGLKQFIKEVQGKDSESINAKRIFELEKLPGLVEKLGNRKIGISERGTPNLSKYK